MFLSMCEIGHLEIDLRIIYIFFELSVYDIFHFSNGLLTIFLINLNSFVYSRMIFFLGL